MTQKENRGGILTNEQVEEDLKAKGADTPATGYRGSQDTGDAGKRDLGTEVQRRDGAPPDDLKEEGSTPD